jgi:Ran GTPase-activating protein (RanGAP) involved in mRNA processing and transport
MSAANNEEKLLQVVDDTIQEDTQRGCCVCSTSDGVQFRDRRWFSSCFPRRKISLKLHRSNCSASNNICCISAVEKYPKRLHSSLARTVAVHSPCETQKVYTNVSSRQLRNSLNENLEHLSITGRRVERRFLQCFSRTTLDSLTHLTLTGNHLCRDPRSVRLLLTNLPTQSLCHLNLSWNGLDHEAIALLGRRCLENMKLQSIRLCGNPIGPKGLKVLVKEGNLQRVPVIDLWDCDIGDDGAAILAESMILPDARVKRLVLDMNCIGNSGVQALAVGMIHCPSLVALDLHCNNIDSRGVRALAPALLCSNVEQLNLRANQVGPAGAKILGQILNDTCLQRLLLCHNGIGDEGVQYLASALAAMRPQQEEHGNPVSTSTALSSRPILQELSLSFNFLTIRSVKSLATALATNTSLKRLFLSGNLIDRRSAMQFCEVLQTTNQSLLQLTVLDLSYENHLVQDKLNLYLRANTSGRRHWGDLSIPLAAWTRKLPDMTPDLLYGFLNSRPDIIIGSHH